MRGRLLKEGVALAGQRRRGGEGHRQWDGRRSFDLGHQQLHHQGVPPAEIVQRRDIAGGDQEVAEQGRDPDHPPRLTHDRGGGDVQQHAAGADRPHHPHRMGRAGGGPHGPLRRGDPGALRGRDHHHAVGGVEELTALVGMPVEFERRRIFIADADHGPGDVIVVVGVLPGSGHVPLAKVKVPNRNAGRRRNAYRPCIRKETRK